jgi:hypothetical protein
MSRQTSKTLIAVATIIPLSLLTLAPSSALAWGRGGFGIGLGLGVLAGSALSRPAYVEQPRVLVAPAPVRVVEPERHRHHERTADVKPSKASKASKERAPVVTRAMTPAPAATPVAPAPDARQRCLQGHLHPGIGVRTPIHAGRHRHVAPESVAEHPAGAHHGAG